MKTASEWRIPLPPPHPTPPPLDHAPFFLVLDSSRVMAGQGRIRKKRRKRNQTKKKRHQKKKKKKKSAVYGSLRTRPSRFFLFFFLKRPIDFYGYYFFISLSAIDIAHFTIIPFTEIISTRIELRLLLFVSFFQLFLELHMMEEDVSVVIDCNRLAFH